MFREFLFIACLTGIPVFGAGVQLQFSLPSGAVSNAMQLDANGNIYLAGYLIPQDPVTSQDTSDAFVAKLSADGSRVLYFITLSGSNAESAAGIAVGSDGSAYVAGSTYSTDFPVTAGAFQTNFNSQGSSQGFLVKVNPTGSVTYATYVNGTSFTQLTGIAADSAGQIFLTGKGGPGYSISSNQPEQGFTLEMDASMTTVLLSVYGYGGGLIALDSQGNIYLAGSAQPQSGTPDFGLPPLPSGAFQSTHAGQICFESLGPGGPFDLPCQYQYVAKLDSDGNLLWATYVTGTYGAIAAGMAVDSEGEVIVAGTTNSTDYPVTQGAFQTAYNATAPLLPGAGISFIGSPSATGFVTKVDSAGTGLIWSTYFGGSLQDQITGMAINASGDILLSGRASSNDLVFTDTPEGCRPSPNQVLGFVARLASDGATAGATHLVQGAADCLYLSCVAGLGTYQTGWPIALSADGSAVVAGPNGTVALVAFNSSSRVTCVTDPADNAQLSSVAPGQLISIFGTDLAMLGGAAQSSADFGVYFNGVAAPILYSSVQQINVQVPFEIAGANAVQMQVLSRLIPNPVSEIRTMGVIARQPSIFLSTGALQSTVPGWSTCGGAEMDGQTAVALNADGTVNDCNNPAPAGSAITVFLNGFGVATPALATGAIEGYPAVQISPSLAAGGLTGTTVIATTTVPGSISGVSKVQLQDGGQSTLLNGASLGGLPLRERVILIWTR